MNKIYSEANLTLERVPFYFVRHGETDWNTQKKITGQLDIPLNDKGREQAACLAAAIKKLNIATLVCSPLWRARETANILNQYACLPILENTDLKEKNCGCLQGFSYTVGEPKRNEILEEWEGKLIPEGAESWEDFNERTVKAINDSLKFSAPVLIVAHGGTYRAISKALHKEIDEVPNCTLIHFNPRMNTMDWDIVPLKHENEMKV